MQPNQKLNAITGVWKQKYEDLIVEKVELEQKIQDLEQELEDRIEIAQLQVSTITPLPTIQYTVISLVERQKGLTTSH